MRERDNSVSFAMLPSALLVSLLFGDSVHYGILLFGLIEGAAIFGTVSAPRGGWIKFVLRSRLMLDPKRSDTHREAARLALGELRQDHLLLLLFFSFVTSASLLRLSCLASRAMGVAQWFVDLCAHPQTVQKYRKLPGHGHHRSLLCVLGSPRGYLLSVTPQVRVLSERT